MTPQSVTFLLSKDVAKRLNTTPEKVIKLPINHYRLPHHFLYTQPDVDAYVQQVDAPPPVMTHTDATLSRDEFAEWIHIHPMSVKRWGRVGHGPVFMRGTTKNDPPRYPVKTVQTWLLSCRVVVDEREAA